MIKLDPSHMLSFCSNRIDKFCSLFFFVQNQSDKFSNYAQCDARKHHVILNSEF